MKKLLLIFIFYLITGQLIAQKTLLVEKIGSPKKYFFHAGDYLKLRVSNPDTLLNGKLWSISDSVISVAELRPFDIRLSNVGFIYKQFPVMKRAGKKLAFGSAGIFTIIVINHLINNEQVFTPDLFIISGSILGCSLISFSLDEKRCRIGNRWKIKVLDFPVDRGLP